jgi:hypothetical protein
MSAAVRCLPGEASWRLRGRQSRKPRALDRARGYVRTRVTRPTALVTPTIMRYRVAGGRHLTTDRRPLPIGRRSSPEGYGLTERSGSWQLTASRRGPVTLGNPWTLPSGYALYMAGEVVVRLARPSDARAIAEVSVASRQVELPRPPD